MLAIISKIPEEDETFELVYPVYVNGSHVIAVANIDTGAQCSAIRSNVAKVAGVDWCRIKNKGCLRSVSGEPLTIYGKTKICIQAGGLTSISRYVCHRRYMSTAYTWFAMDKEKNSHK